MAGIPYTKVDVDIYEQHYASDVIDAAEAAENRYHIADASMNTDASGSTEKAKLARIDVNGVQTTILDASTNGTDTWIEVASLTVGDRVHAWFPKATGTLSSNVATGKFTRPYKQIAFNHDVTYDDWQTGGLGSVSKDNYTGAASGTLSFALEKNDGATLKDFILAGRNTIYMCISVKDSHLTTAEYTIYNAALMSGHSTDITNVDGERGLMRETFRATFKPEVEVSTLA